MKGRKVLVVEDDLDLADLLSSALDEAGLQVVMLHHGAEAAARALSEAVNAVILDVGLPDCSGFDVCRELRSRSQQIPILFLTSRGDEIDRVTGFAVGADDYVVKPFSVRELVFRIQALLRRSGNVGSSAQSEGGGEIAIGEIRVDPHRRRAYLRGAELELTALEFDLLLFFVQHPGRPFSREQLMQEIWAMNSSNFAPTVTTQISRLRKKIEPDPANPTYIRTKYGIGYQFVDPDRDELP